MEVIKFLQNTNIPNLIDEAKGIINTTSNFKSGPSKSSSNLITEVDFGRQIGTEANGSGSHSILQFVFDQNTGEIVTAFSRKNSQIF